MGPRRRVGDRGKQPVTTSQSPAAGARIELTLRGVLLGVAITLIFTAANVYLGLKVGITFATSIPAAVISMALLRAFRDSTIWENNIVQTVASAAGAMSSLIFVLPGLVMVGWWTGFPFWMSFGACAIGGVLGVMYTIPLRRALVTQSSLPYPEGVAGAAVLKVGSGSRESEGEAAEDGRKGFLTLVVGSIASALLAITVSAKLVADEVSIYAGFGRGAASGVGLTPSLALMGAGHLMGVSVGMAALAGLVIAWGGAVPILTWLHPMAGTPAEVAQAVWSTKVRFIGAGAIGAASIWTLGKLAAPVCGGVASALKASGLRRSGGGESLPRTERDLPIGLVALVSLACLAPMAVLLWSFLAGGPLAALTWPLVGFAIIYVAVAGFMIAAVCGYMAGLIGSSNSPVSGVAILAVVGAALMSLTIVKAAGGRADAPALVAFALFVTAVQLSVAVSANDNLQDLKTGQLVDATPWRQQVALVIGVVAGSAVIPPVLSLMNRAYGFAGAPNLHAIASHPLPAPQATLISSLAEGVILGKLDWSLIGVGALIGAGLVVVDELLRRTGRFSLPPLGAGLAIYLPSSLIVPTVIGSVIGWLYDRWAGRGAAGEPVRRLGVLVASGLIVGESLFNVALAGLIVATGRGEPLALTGDSFAPIAKALCIPVFVALGVALYVWTRRLALKPAR